MNLQYMMSNSLVLNDVMWEARSEQYLSISSTAYMFPTNLRVGVVRKLMHLRGMFSKAFLLG